MIDKETEELWDKMTEDEKAMCRHYYKELAYLMSCFHKYADHLKKKYKEDEK